MLSPYLGHVSTGVGQSRPVSLHSSRRHYGRQRSKTHHAPTAQPSFRTTVSRRYRPSLEQRTCSPPSGINNAISPVGQNFPPGLNSASGPRRDCVQDFQYRACATPLVGHEQLLFLDSRYRTSGRRFRGSRTHMHYARRLSSSAGIDTRFRPRRSCQDQPDYAPNHSRKTGTKQ